MASRLATQIDEQKAANQSALPYDELYRGHREQLTGRILRTIQEGSGRSLCVLGAGNCYDLDLERLSAYFGALHLVDLDQEALERARTRLPPRLRDALVCHAPVDLTGMLGKLERWAQQRLTPEELMAHPEHTSLELLRECGGPFDLVVSACVLTQMQLAVLQVLGERHRLFEAVRHTLSVTHLRTLAALTRPAGSALLVNDLVALETLGHVVPQAPGELRALYERVTREGNVIYVAHPGLLAAICRDDPMLRCHFQFRDIRDIWLWQQGPERTFLVYALELARLDPELTSTEDRR